MTEEESIFDPSLKKKKKKKKTTFDIESAMAEGTGGVDGDGADASATDKENMEPAKTEDMDIDDNLDLDNFGRKKKKKKKAFNLEELDGALPDTTGKTKEDGMEGGENEEAIEDSLSLDMDFSTKKKKKKKKKDLDELVAEEEKKEKDQGDKDHAEDTWLGSDRDYTYDELLTRVFDIMRDKNPDMVAGKKQKFVMRPPQVVRIGTKKTSFANFTEICKTLHRQPKHLLDFLLAELGTSGSVDGNSQLIIKGRFQQKQIENVLRRYIKEYVTCHTCRSPDTILQKDTRLFFLQCETCGSRCSVASIKSGFQAVTGKRAAIRAKTA
ncbi:eukaryotic translation initiation factor 2 subunit 2-like [Macrosteles quadrilineatus]|uniref:eukaryotic translation initiation factor 2 subunit 2-like n=1 Tax=Macrosteles quadrilineatus TaxID=74068 RepID=UPI0023E1BD50|nr:eukaryotic translation initiation factor 2 subunit 2-like isoform X2 [Macrosteles quadrilineatus]XP_054290287.1 eukaryotic translation initiation factor 2 subunit 2-like [Macrosteles quadrilineatus]